MKGLGFAEVHEIEAGEELSFAGLTVRGQPAWHRGRRHPVAALTPSLGYEVRGSVSLYHAGDTGEVPELSSFAGPLDVVCLPVSGYGARLPEDHMSPRTAAVAVEILRPALAVPIHWGTYQLTGMTRRMRERDLCGRGLRCCGGGADVGTQVRCWSLARASNSLRAAARGDVAFAGRRASLT